MAAVGSWQGVDRGWRLLILKSQGGFNTEHKAYYRETGAQNMDGVPLRSLAGMPTDIISMLTQIQIYIAV